MLEDVNFSLLTCLGIHTTLHPPDMLAFTTVVVARALRTIQLVILMLIIDRGKVIQLPDGITTNCLPAFPPIRRTRLAVLILHPPYVSATHHI